MGHYYENWSQKENWQDLFKLNQTQLTTVDFIETECGHSHESRKQNWMVWTFVNDWKTTINLTVSVQHNNILFTLLATSFSH